jgi:acyl transferase domain-containing protein
MEDTAHRAIAIVGVSALLPDARDAASFWENVKSGRYSISEVPVERWDPELYWDPNPKAPDKTYSKIGGWVLDWEWLPLEWHLPIPPRVSDAMDRTQKWAVIGCREALADFGYPERPLNPERTAVILGNAMAGDLHYQTAMRISFPEYARELAAPRTRCPGSWPTSSPGGWPAFSTFMDPTTSSMPPVLPPRRRSTRRSRVWSRRTMTRS